MRIRKSAPHRKSKINVSEQTFKITGMDLSGYMVKDAARAIGFYRDVLGLDRRSSIPTMPAPNTNSPMPLPSVWVAEAVR